MKNNVLIILIIIIITTFILISDINKGVHSYKYKKYEDIKKTIKTGDIFLFNSHCISTSQLIKLLTKSCWSHIGIVCKHKDDIYIYEFIDDFNKSGFDIKLLDKKIKKYDGDVLYKSINKCIGNDIFINTINKYKNKEFTPSIIMFLSYLKRSFGLLNKSDDKFCHCSEFVCNVLKYTGVINCDLNGRFVYPCDFCENKNTIKFINDYKFKESYIVKLSS